MRRFDGLGDSKKKGAIKISMRSEMQGEQNACRNINSTVAAPTRLRY